MKAKTKPELIKDIETLTNKNRGLQGRITRLEEKVKAKEMRMEGYKAANQTLQNENVSLQAYASDCKQDIGNALRDRDEWRKKFWHKDEEHKKELARLQATIDEQRRDHEHLRITLGDLIDDKKALEAALSMFTDRRPQLRFPVQDDEDD